MTEILHFGQNAQKLVILAESFKFSQIQMSITLPNKKTA